MNQLKSIDLFCGAGGLAEGLRQAGFQCLYGNDLMPTAIETFAFNHPKAIADCAPIGDVDASDLRKKLNLVPGELDVLVGGPPCQGFSINAPGRFLHDPRNQLFRDFARMLLEFQPKCFLMENVPGMLSMGDGKVFEEILGVFSRLGYEVSVKILFAAHYGVPQERWRLILLGSKFGAIAHPQPTHFAIGRANFRGGATLTMRPESEQRKTLRPFVTLSDAICDLPKLRMGEGEETVNYPVNVRLSEYGKLLRNPSGMTFNHYAAHLSPQNVERMKHVKPGGSWRDIPVDLLPSGMQKARRTDHTKRYGRLHPERLAGTVLTKCDPHWSSVFLPDQDRTLTVREAARIQSFPDSYRFFGSRVSQYEQVGNAVPVLMAKAIGDAIAAHLCTASRSAPSEAELVGG
ncbi:MAG: DNA cytosine methyltransferase [Casimicrobium sp.]